MLRGQVHITDSINIQILWGDYYKCSSTAVDLHRNKMQCYLQGCLSILCMLSRGTKFSRLLKNSIVMQPISSQRDELPFPVQMCVHTDVNLNINHSKPSCNLQFTAVFRTHQPAITCRSYCPFVYNKSSVVMVTHCDQIYARKEISRPGFLDILVRPY